MAATTPSPTTIDDIVIGQTRIRDRAGYRGTILYVGTVASASKHNQHTLYAGVQWDDPRRGKHDGSVLDRQSQVLVRHFVAGHATGGSFVKLFHKDWCLGVPLSASLLQQRYVPLDDPHYVANPRDNNHLGDHCMQTVSGKNDKRVQFVGEVKIRHYQQLQDLRSISLRLSGLSSIDAESLLQENYSHLQQVDLAGNLFSKWDHVFELLRVFPNLTSLSMASNRLNDLTAQQVQQQPYESLTHLNLTDTNLCNLESIALIGRCFPNLRELILANNYDNNNKDGMDTTLSSEDMAKSLSNLEYLDASHNTLFDSVEIWSTLPQLRVLSVNDNLQLTRFDGTPFATLEQLQLNHTGLVDWPVLSKTVTHLRLSALPWIDTKEEPPTNTISVRSRLVAHFPQLFHVNGSRVSKMERLDAARWCLSHCHGRSRSMDEAAEHWKAEFPQLLEVPSQENNTNGSDKFLSVRNVTISSLAVDSCQRPPLIRRLPVTLEVSQLKKLCARHFGLDVDLQVFTFRRTPQSLPEPVRTLLDLPDGAHLYMKEREELEHNNNNTGYRNIEQQEEQLNHFWERQKRANKSLGF